MQTRGDSSEEELRALEMDVTGKVAILDFICLSRTYVPPPSSFRYCSHRGVVHVWKSSKCYERYGTELATSHHVHHVQILRLHQVVDKVLKEPDQADQVLYNRAKVRRSNRLLICHCLLTNWVLPSQQGLLLAGAIFKSTVPDESDEERRELERSV